MQNIMLPIRPQVMRDILETSLFIDQMSLKRIWKVLEYPHNIYDSKSTSVTGVPPPQLKHGTISESFMILPTLHSKLQSYNFLS